MAGLIDTALRYTTADKRRNLPNPSKIPIDGDLYNNLNTYRSAVRLYREFRNTAENDLRTDPLPEREPSGERIGLERDMQAALRKEIDQLEPGLVIIDRGEERSVDSGFIDITARDASGRIVVIELKAGSAGQRAIAQVMSYMGDMTTEEEGGAVRGILIASEFDAKAQAAARIVPSLSLLRYGVRFMFSKVFHQASIEPAADISQGASPNFSRSAAS